MTKYIKKTLEFAIMKHKGQLYSGKDFIYHPLQVYGIVNLLKPQSETLQAAALLHDTIEDTDTTWDEIKAEFGEEVANLVLEVTKVKPSSTEAAYFPHLNTREGILLKFCDRAANLSNLSDWDSKKIAWYLKSSKFWKSSREE